MACGARQSSGCAGARRIGATVDTASLARKSRTIALQRAGFSCRRKVRGPCPGSPSLSPSGPALYDRAWESAMRAAWDNRSQRMAPRGS
jgi:hypothetical protein